MAFLGWLQSKTKGQKLPDPDKTFDRGLLVFENTSEVIRAEKLLKAQGIAVKVMGPPPSVQTGCDMVITFPMTDALFILRILKDAGLSPLQTVPVDNPLLEPVGLFQVKDFGEHLMVRAANMKITACKKTRQIVNVSGGGCPDVPYLAALMVGKSLDDTPLPRDKGHTLCGYALQLAYEEMVRLCSQ